MHQCPSDAQVVRYVKCVTLHHFASLCITSYQIHLWASRTSSSLPCRASYRAVRADIQVSKCDRGLRRRVATRMVRSTVRSNKYNFNAKHLYWILNWCSFRLESHQFLTVLTLFLVLFSEYSQTNKSSHKWFFCSEKISDSNEFLSFLMFLYQYINYIIYKCFIFILS